MDAFDQIEIDSPEVKKKYPRNNGRGDAFDQLATEGEPTWKGAVRTAVQPALGLAEATPAGLTAGGLHFLGMGAIDEEEIEHLRKIHEREEIPFDEDALRKAHENALAYFPTVANMARVVEEQTGIPLEPKEWYQKALRLASMGYGALPGTNLQKAAGGAATAATSQALQAAGVPEPFADLLGFAAGAPAAMKTPAYEAQFTRQKPSGVPERGFESLTQPREVSAKKFQQINDKLKGDFEAAYQRSLEGSPIGETLQELQNNPRYKQESRELLNAAQEHADTLDFSVPTSEYVRALESQISGKGKGFLTSEYDRQYDHFVRDGLNDLNVEQTTPGQLVEQYRKNNQELGEYFEPGASKALNRAKRDAILTKNRVIADLIEKTDPELGAIFREGNDRWKKLMDAEAVEEFISAAFPEGEKVNFRKLQSYFDDPAHQFTFKRALGEEGFQKFSQAVEDMLTSERPYKMLRVAQAKGLGEGLQTLGAYVLHPNVAAAKIGKDIIAQGYKTLMNSVLDKPKLGLQFAKATEALKKGDFTQAAKTAEVLDRRQTEAKPKAVEAATVSPKPPQPPKAPAALTLKEPEKAPAPKQPKKQTEKQQSKEAAPKTAEKAAEKEPKAAAPEEAPAADLYTYTKEDFPTKKEAAEYLKRQVAQLKKATPAQRPTIEAAIEGIKKLLKEYEAPAPKKKAKT